MCNATLGRDRGSFPTQPFRLTKEFALPKKIFGLAMLLTVLQKWFGKTMMVIIIYKLVFQIGLHRYNQVITDTKD